MLKPFKPFFFFSVNCKLKILANLHANHLPKLSKHFRVISYDFRGHGKSPISNKNFTFENLIEDLERVREKTKIERAHFFGHSLGGMIAPAYEKKYPDNTISVGLLSTVAGRSFEDKIKIYDVIKKMEIH